MGLHRVGSDICLSGAGGSVSVRVISLCFMSWHKKKGKGSKKQSGRWRAGGETERKKTTKKLSEPAGFSRLCGTTGHFCRL